MIEQLGGHVVSNQGQPGTYTSMETDRNFGEINILVALGFIFCRMEM